MKTPKLPSDAQYYSLTIGPVSRARLDREYPSGEGRLRHAVKTAFHEMFPDINMDCASGWGVTPEMEHAISFETYDDELKRAVIRSYYDENKPLPRVVRAWELLFNEELTKANKKA